MMPMFSQCVLFSIYMLLSVLQSAAAEDASPGYDIGVYYFPGWRDNQRGAPSAKPWDRIKAYPERQPLLGWYQEGSTSVAEQQIDWMSTHGIDYIVFDWPWDGAPFLDHAISAFVRAKNNQKLKFSLLWTVQLKVPQKQEQFTSMIRYWIREYFPHSNYLRINGKPAIFVFGADRLEENARTFGTTTAELFVTANNIAIDAGYGGIYFIAGTTARRSFVLESGPKRGYNAFSAYNYHQGFSGSPIPSTLPSHSYDELDKAYQMNWDWILKNSYLPYILPITSGWNKRAWGGSTDPLHDNSFGSPSEFERHLQAAKMRLDEYPAKTLKMAVICCWNEFGEGSYIEPTKKYGTEYLDRIQKVFGSQQ